MDVVMDSGARGSATRDQTRTKHVSCSARTLRAVLVRRALSLCRTFTGLQSSGLSLGSLENLTPSVAHARLALKCEHLDCPEARVYPKRRQFKVWGLVCSVGLGSLMSFAG